MLRQLSIYITGHDLGQYRPGLGPNRWGYIRILFPFSGRFYAASEAHDLAYCLGTTKLDKALADLEFLVDCLDASGNNPIARFFAYQYYYIVAEFGDSSFNYSISMREEVAGALRQSNQAIQELNSSPDRPDYSERCLKIEEEFKNRIADILNRYSA